MTHIDSISCGQGAPSLFLIVMAGEGLFHADVVIVADTGWENDMLWNTGRRSTAKEFFEEVTKPLANRYGIDAAFVRTLDENGVEYEPIQVSVTRKHSLSVEKDNVSKWYGMDIPMFGSNGGRMNQSCTSKWKKSAIRQELRRRGADTAISFMGLHLDEVRRVKPTDMRWNWLGWPLLDLQEDGFGKTKSMGIGKRLSRAGVQSGMEKRNIPYLVTTECDGCPHKDLERWKRTSPETLRELSKFEAQFNGEMFLTKNCIPLLESINKMEQESDDKHGDMFDSCDSGYCFL